MIQWVIQILKVATVVLMSGLVLMGSVRAFDYYRDQNTPDDLGRVYTVTIGEDDDVDDVAKKLLDADLISTDLYFKARLRAESKTLEPGVYRLTKGQSVSQIIELITSEDSVARTTDNPDLTITIIEGWRTEQIAEELERLGLNGGADAFMEAVRSYPSDMFEFLADRPDPESLEGYLFPDTYNFKADTNPTDLITNILNNFDQKVTPDMRARATDMGLTLNQVLTFASLVEREAAAGEERPIIADIYMRRYSEGWRLDADPTVQYVLGEPGNWWPELDGDDLQVDDPYNMYVNYGMPPGPIANPGYSSINAVLNPVATDYYFFVANPDGSGTHLFAASLDAHNQNIAYADGQVDSPAPGSNPFEQ
ncbi:MAG: endolytic transglycosylase MltG [Thermomicrobiales bacterium]|nr:endolytic transglycosylase MltG [Thermomicrobiales bacterium]